MILGGIYYASFSDDFSLNCIWSSVFFFWILIMVILGVIGSFTEKVEQRIELMMEPMNASVSDFARLINFTKSDSEGILVGYSWCNDHGVCLPLQVLSDYMPLLIEKILGFGGALFILIIFNSSFWICCG